MVTVCEKEVPMNDREAAAFVRVRPAFLQHLCRQGVLRPTYRIGCRRRWAIGDLTEQLAAIAKREQGESDAD